MAKSKASPVTKKKAAKKSKDAKAADTISRDSIDKNNVVANYRTGRFVVTAAVQNAEVNGPFLATLENYCTINNATLIILGMRPHQRPLEKQPEFYDPVLLKYFKSGQLVSSFMFNENLIAFDLRNAPQLAEPLRGLSRLTFARGKRISILVAAPVQAMKVLPGKVGSLPRITHSTGVITKSCYQPTRPGKLAEQRHVHGALVVELDDEIFHIRQLQGRVSDDSIIDLGNRYYPDGRAEFERAEAIEVGDLHAGETDPSALQFLAEICEQVQPRRVFVQDVFSGASVNHHITQKKIARSLVPTHIADLASELEVCGQVLRAIRHILPEDAEGFVKESNHDFFLTRYLDEMRFKDDVNNIEVALELALKMRMGFNPLAYAVDPDGDWTWLSGGLSHRVDGVEMAQHGHLGVNGSRGSLAGLSEAYGHCFAGHSHTPGICPGGAWQVGTSTFLKLGYNSSGASTWLQCNGILYANGQRQLVTLVGTKWRA